MTAIQIPTGLEVIAFSMPRQINQRAFGSFYGGSETVVNLLNSRWRIHLELAPMGSDDAGLIEGVIGSLEGMANVVDLWHMSRPTPKGSMRGTPTVNGAHSQGATTLSIATVAGATLKIGDIVGVNNLLLMAKADATADGGGILALSLTHPIRTALSNAATITWDHPKSPFRCITDLAAPQYHDGIADSVSLDFVEDIS